MLRSRALFFSAVIVGCGGDDGVASATSTGSTSDATSTSGGSSSGAADTSSSGASTTTDAAGSTSSTDASSTAADTDTSGEVDALAPDFGLVDVNEGSASFGQVVSPRDYLEKVSGWYFAHAT